MGHISIQRRNGVVHGYTVYLGVNEAGDRVRKFFPDLADAKRYLDQHDTTPLPIGELWDRRTEILYNLDRLRPTGTSLTDVVSHFLNQRTQSTVTLSELLEKFLAEKKQIGRSPSYAKRMRYGLGRFITFVGGDRKIGDVTRQDVTKYVYEHHRDNSPVTKKNTLADISVLFGYGVREDLIATNPVEKITRPTIPFTKPSVLSPSDFEILLRR